MSKGYCDIARNNAMDCNACSTYLLLLWMKDSCNRRQFKGKVSMLLDRFRFLLFKFGLHVVVPGHGFSIQAALLIGNLRQVVASTHRQIEKAWGLQWQSMMQDLQMQWESDGIPSHTVLQFALTAVRTRREQAKPAWKGKNLELLEKLQPGLLKFVSDVAEMTVNQNYSQFVGQAVPPRSYSRCQIVCLGSWVLLFEVALRCFCPQQLGHHNHK